MLLTLLLIYLLNSGSADGENEIVEIMPRCSDSPVNMTFTPVEGYVGRYTAELCAPRDLAHREWEMHLSFYKTRDYCNSDTSPSNKLANGKTHSSNVEWVSSNHNCTGNQTVCMSALFDLIFSACYSIGTRFKDASAPPKYYYFDVVNNYTEQQFHKNQATVDLKYYVDYMSVTWHTGIPPSIYKVELYNQTDLMSGEPVHNCTTIDHTTIKCYLSPNYGCYMIYLQHIAPWIGGIFYKQESVPKEICRNATAAGVPLVAGSARSWAWAAAGAGAALLLLLAAAVAARARASTRAQLKVLGTWLKHATSGSSGGGGARAAGARHVLLVHAREGERAARALAALKAALACVVDGEVMDLFSPETVRASGPAAGEWTRAQLSRGDVAVLLLQSPALHLHAAHHLPPCLHPPEDQLQLVSPLLGRKVVARTPHFGDALLQFVLRTISENLAAWDDYNKYYVATISELPTEIFPYLVPYRRYSLPGAAPLLLRDLAPHRAPPQPVLDNFTHLLTEFVDYANENPDYLMDELMLVDN